MDPHSAIKLGLLASLWLVVFSLGARSAPEDALYLIRRPQLLLRAIASLFIVVPGMAIAICLLFPLVPAVKFALVALAVSPVPPILPMKQAKAGGKGDYAIGLLVVAALASLVATPLLVEAASAILGVEATIPVKNIATTLVLSIALPLGAGFGLRALAPAFAIHAQAYTQKLGTVLLMGGIGVVVVFMWPAIMDLVGNGSILAIAGMAILSLAAGHLLGSYPVDESGSLALASASRHPGVALAIATASFPDRQNEATAAVLLSLLVGALVTAPYVRQMKKRAAERLDARR